jgi:hypothetical protein
LLPGRRPKDAALAALEQRLGDRGVHLVRVEKAIAEFETAVQDFEQADRSVFAGWSAEFPPLDLFYSGSNLRARLAGALRTQPARLTNLSARVGPLAESYVSVAARMIEEIRSAPLPDRPEPGDMEVAA